jgi:hypothetical protein
MRILIPTVALFLLIPFSLYASARSNSDGLAERVAELEAQVAAMEEILQFVHVETETINFLAGPHWIIEGANVHVRNGTVSGLGNLIVGYNQKRPTRNLPPEIRTGSHNLVVGSFHSYSSSGGFVAGRGNKVTGENASVCGGILNEARGKSSSVSGGRGNVASGFTASVSGGDRRTAPDEFNWVAGELFEPN